MKAGKACNHGAVAGQKNFAIPFHHGPETEAAGRRAVEESPAMFVWGFPAGGERVTFRAVFIRSFSPPSNRKNSD
jgi:hypothetical protein